MKIEKSCAALAGCKHRAQARVTRAIKIAGLVALRHGPPDIYDWEHCLFREKRAPAREKYITAKKLSNGNLNPRY